MSSCDGISLSRHFKTIKVAFDCLCVVVDAFEVDLGGCRSFLLLVTTS